MRIYIYKAVTKEGKRIKGQIEASDEKQAVVILKENNYFPYFLEEKKEFFLKELLEKFTQKIGLSDIAVFTRQLSTMINAGLSLTEALSLLKTQSKPIFALVIDDILRRIEGGESLAKALEAYPKIFGPVYVALVKAGETAGVLDEVLLRMADNLEGQREFKSKIKGAMIYPIIILIGMVLVSAVMMIFVIPKLLGLYKEIGAELPGPTKILIGISGLAVKFWWLVLVLLVGLIYLFKLFYNDPKGRKKIDELKFKIPIVGKLITNTILAELTRTLGLLVGTGVTITEALDVASKTANNFIIEESIKTAEEEVKKGGSLSVSLSRNPYFPAIVPQMISVGEETGKLDEVLGKVSKYFQSEAEESLKGLTTAIEPIIMIVLGVGVGFLVIAVILPMYSLTSQIK